MSQFFPAALIKKKREGETHTREELAFLINSYVKDELPDYQMSAWLMSVFFKGMTSEETAHLTEIMRDSGRVLNFEGLRALPVDKHSTGGVGDKTTLILAPIAAAAGVPVPMIAGRGLGHTGGTLDKLESIPGFNVHVGLDQFQRQVETSGLCIMGQTEEICPADKRIYALRDVTATVESMPLICASIMSKKLAEGLKGLVLDVKFGSGAFMKTAAAAEELARSLMAIGHHADTRVAALITNMEQPLGRYIGNSLEIEECLAILRGEAHGEFNPNQFEDTRELSLELAGHMIWLSGLAKSAEEGLQTARTVLEDGRALTAFEQLCREQGGRLDELPHPRHRQVLESTADGVLSRVETEALGWAAIALGAGRLQKTDPVEPTAGIQIHKKLGDKVSRGEPLFTLYASDSSRFEKAESLLRDAFKVTSAPAGNTPLIYKRIYPE